MTNEEKQLLLKDLCARLLYGVKCRQFKLDSQVVTLTADLLDKVDNLEPYLRPMSSMTEDEENEWNKLQVDPLLERMGKHTKLENLMLLAKSQYEPTDWLLEHHFDYRGLIEKGLALEAPEDMYKND